MFAVSVFTLLLLLYDGWMDNWYRPVCTTSYKEVRSVPEITKSCTWAEGFDGASFTMRLFQNFPLTCNHKVIMIIITSMSKFCSLKLNG